MHARSFEEGASSTEHKEDCFVYILGVSPLRWERQQKCAYQAGWGYKQFVTVIPIRCHKRVEQMHTGPGGLFHSIVSKISRNGDRRRCVQTVNYLSFEPIGITSTVLGRSRNKHCAEDRERRTKCRCMDFCDCKESELPSRILLILPLKHTISCFRSDQTIRHCGLIQMSLFPVLIQLINPKAAVSRVDYTKLSQVSFKSMPT